MWRLARARAAICTCDWILRSAPVSFNYRRSKRVAMFTLNRSLPKIYPIVIQWKPLTSLRYVARNGDVCTLFTVRLQLSERRFSLVNRYWWSQRSQPIRTHPFVPRALANTSKPACCPPNYWHVEKVVWDFDPLRFILCARVASDLAANKSGSISVRPNKSRTSIQFSSLRYWSTAPFYGGRGWPRKVATEKS